MLENKLRNDLREATLNRNDVKKNTIKIVLGEISRLNKNAGESATDDEIYSIINKLIKSEILVLEYSGRDASKSEYIKILENYLPKMMTKEEIKSWISINIQMENYPNKMAAMKPIMLFLKGKANGSLVKEVLLGN